MKLIAITSIILLTACGSKGGNGSSDGDEAPTQQTDSGETDASTDGAESAQYAKLVADAAALPACGADHEGSLVYVKASGEFQNCASGAWSVVHIGPTVTGSFTCDGTIGGVGDYYYQVTRSSDGTGRMYAEFGDATKTRLYQKDAALPAEFEFVVGGMKFRITDKAEGLARADMGADFWILEKDQCMLVGAL